MGQRKRDWVGESVSLDRPNPARIYDYLLGGHHNFAADRAAAEKMLEVFPYSAEGAVAQRAFVRRVIDLVTTKGVDQFLDIGSGLPTAGNVHDMARETIRDARVVYVDVDPVVITHSSHLLKDVPGATIIEGDLRRPREILEHEELRSHLDLDRPLALTMTAVLHFIVDDTTAYDSVATMIDAVAPGSYVAISHGLMEERSREEMEKAVADYKAAASVKARSREEIARFMLGLELVEPGLVRPPLWRPEGPDDVLFEDPEVLAVLAAVGRKP